MHITKENLSSLYKNESAAEKALLKLSDILPINIDYHVSKLISYITFDGHLAADLSNIFLSSKDKTFISDFAKFLKGRFSLSGRFEKCTDGFGTSYKYRIFNKPFCRILELAGAPKGNKSNNIFDVPVWIKENNNYSKIYLKIAFDCEGSVWRDSNGYPRIRMKIHKSENNLDNGIQFMSSLKYMLSLFDIKTTEIWTTNGYNKNFTRTKGLCFGIKKKSFKTYLKHINFRIKEKRKRLRKIMGSYDVGQA